MGRRRPLGLRHTDRLEQVDAAVTDIAAERFSGGKRILAGRSFPLHSHDVHVGIRFPLGVASAGLAILSHLADGKIEEYSANARPETEWGQAHSEESIRERIESMKVTGYAVNPGLLVEGSWGIGAAVFDRYGQPAWALSLTGVETRFRLERRVELGFLLGQARGLSQRLRR